MKTEPRCVRDAKHVGLNPDVLYTHYVHIRLIMPVELNINRTRVTAEICKHC